MSEEFKNKLEKYHYIRKLEKAERTMKDIVAKCDTEIQRIKRYKPLPITSRYRKKHDIDDHPPTCGFVHRFSLDPDFLGSHEEWHQAFERFEKKKVNIYGKKVDRSKVFADKQEIKNFKYGKKSR
jgi:hypothetical protein